MKVLLRADASPVQGTGHVMRCLTLSEELLRRGHEVVLLTNFSEVEWLEQVIGKSNTEVLRVRQHELPIDVCISLAPDVVVTDSYEIEAETISLLARKIPVLSIVDGDTRGIVATGYLDHNLGAELEPWPDETSGRLLAGSKFALIRDAVLVRKRKQPWVFQGAVPHIVAVMGGSDPTGTIIDVSQALKSFQGRCTATVVASQQWFEQVQALLGKLDGFEIISPTTELPKVLASADIAISAAGTSAWELCSLGIPSLLIAVVENQSQSLQRMIENKLVLGIDLTRGGNQNFTTQVETMVLSLIEDNELRERLSRESTIYFDGLGKVRVINYLEKIINNET
ncbi:spore coat polysaccharide biosynthesis predicted glycosyltransferase SpsG [Aurantimicrobium minutum]|nr:spore coat polysaccharide biosynthesis predicted glycosyltransferase SpsG [Aurantimicrobium minutum]